MQNLCQWIIAVIVCSQFLGAHPAQFHEKVAGKLISGRVVEQTEAKIVLDKGEYTLGSDVKITKIEIVQKPAQLEEFSFVGFSGGELVSLPDWYPTPFQVGETTAAGVLRRSRKNPELHFIQANRRIFRLPEGGVRGVKKHVELKDLPMLQNNQKVYLIAEKLEDRNVANAICVVPVKKD